MDLLAINETLLALNAAWMRDRKGFAAYCQSFTKTLLAVSEAVSGHLRTAKAQRTGGESDDLLQWTKALAWSSRQYHQALSRGLADYVEGAPDVDDDIRQRALFWIGQIVDMLTPSNFFWTNPKAVQRCVKSEGESLIQGFSNWLIDLQHNDGLPQLTDRSAFVLGRNLAATPGQVVFRNSLMELIQYTSQTALTWQVPIVLIQPWINKYYVFDLSPQNSFVQYLVRQGFTVFITSWKNPGKEMGHVTFEDYMLQGALQAVKVAQDICGSEKVHAAGYCIGGTLLAALAGWLAHEAQQPIADATFFATLVDFADPGNLKALINPSSYKNIEQMTAADGILKGSHIALAFRLLNSAELIWRYVINNYYCGEVPPRSDMLFWNSDSTHLPAAMCTFFLKAFYLENRMIQPNALVLAQRPINLKQIHLPQYVVGSQKDHICPWKTTFQTCRLMSGPVRYVLTNEGHITGIVNPPSPWSRKKFWAGAATRRRDADKWLRGRKPKTGSWWPDWVTWLQSRSGPQRPSTVLQSTPYPPMGPAPGTYVHE